MKGKLVIPIIGVIILSFFGSSFAEQKVQTKSIQVTAGTIPSEESRERNRGTV